MLDINKECFGTQWLRSSKEIFFSVVIKLQRYFLRAPACSCFYVSCFWNPYKFEPLLKENEVLELKLLLMVDFTFACPAMRPSRLWPSLSGEPPLNKLVPSPSACIEKSTQWSPCSRSCGAGVSTRVSNQNPACKLQMETRLCKVRPCSMTQPAQKRPVVSSLIVSYQLVPHLSRSQDLVFTHIHIQYIL